jgi:hypothetical protein
MADQTPTRLPRKIGQFGLVMAAATAVIAGLASPAYANLPHFKSASVSLATSPAASADLGTTTTSATTLPDLLWVWTEVGLGKTANVSYHFDTIVTATFGCVNSGANHPKASNKTTIAEPVGASGDFTADDNGRITGSEIVDTSSVLPPADFSCPTGQTLTALSATFTNNTIKDTTNGVTATDDDISVTLGP